MLSDRGASAGSIVRLADDPKAGIYLAWGVFAGGIAQLVMVLHAARREGMAPRLVRPVFNGDIRKLVGLAIPGVIAGGITQINILIGTIIASMQAGAVSYLYYADRIYQLPLGIVGSPSVWCSCLTSQGGYRPVRMTTRALGQQNRALEFAMLLTLPSAVALFLVRVKSFPASLSAAPSTQRPAQPPPLRWRLSLWGCRVLS
jgi:putative peptidoglycan lipid II flippase